MITTERPAIGGSPPTFEASFSESGAVTRERVAGLFLIVIRKQLLPSRKTSSEASFRVSIFQNSCHLTSRGRPFDFTRDMSAPRQSEGRHGQHTGWSFVGLIGFEGPFEGSVYSTVSALWIGERRQGYPLTES